jgi:hypothetical protein
MNIIWTLLIEVFGSVVFVCLWVAAQKILDASERRHVSEWQAGLGVLALIFVAVSMAIAIILMVAAPMLLVAGWLG